MASYIVPVFILLVVVVGIVEKKDVYSLFIDGVKDGVKTVYTIFPYIFAVTIISHLITDTKILENVSALGTQILPLILMKPLSGGASTAMVVEIFKNYGTDSFLGLFSSIIMASTDTTLYIVCLMSGKTKIKSMKLPIICGLIGDSVAVTVALIISKIMM